VGYRLPVGRSGDRTPVRGEIFDIRPHRPVAHPASCAINIVCLSPGDTAAGRGVDHSPSSGAEDKESVELCLYSLFVPL